MPHSIKHISESSVDCERQIPLEIPANELSNGQKFQVVYTYSVKFVVNLYIY